MDSQVMSQSSPQPCPEGTRMCHDLLTPGMLSAPTSPSTVSSTSPTSQTSHQLSPGSSRSHSLTSPRAARTTADSARCEQTPLRPPRPRSALPKLRPRIPTSPSPAPAPLTRTRTRAFEDGSPEIHNVRDGTSPPPPPSTTRNRCPSSPITAAKDLRPSGRRPRSPFPFLREFDFGLSKDEAKEGDEDLQETSDRESQHPNFSSEHRAPRITQAVTASHRNLRRVLYAPHTAAERTSYETPSPGWQHHRCSRPGTSSQKSHSDNGLRHRDRSAESALSTLSTENLTPWEQQGLLTARLQMSDRSSSSYSSHPGLSSHAHDISQFNFGVIDPVSSIVSPSPLPSCSSPTPTLVRSPSSYATARNSKHSLVKSHSPRTSTPTSSTGRERDRLRSNCASPAASGMPATATGTTGALTERGHFDPSPSHAHRPSHSQSRSTSRQTTSTSPPLLPLAGDKFVYHDPQHRQHSEAQSLVARGMGKADGGQEGREVGEEDIQGSVQHLRRRKMEARKTKGISERWLWIALTVMLVMVATAGIAGSIVWKLKTLSASH